MVTNRNATMIIMFFALSKRGDSPLQIVQEGYQVTQTDSGSLVSFNVPPADRQAFINACRSATYTQWLHDYTRNDFLLAWHDTATQRLIIANDHYGSNEILYHVSADTVVVTDNITQLKQALPDLAINHDKINEFFAFGSIQPPATMLHEVSSLPSAHVLQADVASGQAGTVEYWSPADTLHDKYPDYDTALSGIRAGLQHSVEQEQDYADTYGVALSGGVDSGGLLSMLHAHTGMRPTAITIGPIGPDSPDLPSARLSAKHVGAKHVEVYPTPDELNHLPRYAASLNQPLDGLSVITYGLMARTAQEHGVTRLLYGCGTDNMLGCQKYSQMALRLQQLSWLPGPLQRMALHAYIVTRRGLSADQRKILLAPSHTQRFLHIKSIHQELNQPFLRNNTDPYQSLDTTALDDIFANNDLGMIDRYVMADWRYFHIYNRHSLINRISRPMGITAYNTPYTPFGGAPLLRVTDDMRARNGWDKEIFREAVKPVSPPHLYTNARQSCIIKVRHWLTEPDRHTQVKQQLKDSAFASSVCDIDAFFDAYDTLPTPELFLTKLLVLTYWHDAHFGDA